MDSYLPRILDMNADLARKSQFLFGPRLIGKPTWANESLKDARFRFNLLDRNPSRRLMEDSSILRMTLQRENVTDGVVIIDEIQIIPELLDEVHNLIESTNIHFLLTGSSARKLRGKGVNLLGGRAGIREMYPLVYPEIATMEISLDRILNNGLIPSVFLSECPDDDLYDYIDSYIGLEIQAEGAIRNLPPFSRFLAVVAVSNKEILNYENIAKEVGISRQGVINWFNILYDTLIGFEVPAYRKTLKRKAYASSKLYFFDTGVARVLRGLKSIDENTIEFGKGFENYIAMELRAYLGYRKLRHRLSYWRATSGFEVDFVIDDLIAVETKTTKHFQASDLKGLRALKEENLVQRFVLVCMEEHPMKTDDGIEVLPLNTFLSELWSDKLITCS